VVALSVGDSAVEVPARRAGAVLAGEADVRGAGTDGARVGLPPRGWAVLTG
jgi:hypothetical protein